MSNTKKNLGHVTAYAYYKAGGGTMTEEEFTEYMADFGDAAERAVDAASEAAQSKADAQTAAATATDKADEAAASASSASGSAASAAEDASTASTAANTATGAATTATSAKNDAVSAKTAAQSAKTAAETAASTATTKAGEAATSATNAAASAQSVASSAAQITQNAEDIDALKEDLGTLNTEGTVPTSEQMLSDNYTEDSVPYHFRKTASDNANREELEIVGGSVAWNQLAPESIRNNSNSQTRDTKTFLALQFRQSSSPYTSMLYQTIASPTLLQTILVPTFSGFVQALHSGATSNITLFSGVAMSVIEGHKYLWSINLTSVDVQTIDGFVYKDNMLFDLTAMFGRTIADHIYSLEQATAGAGVSLFRSLFPKDYYAYDAGSIQSVSGLSAHKMTGFNQWDEELEVGTVNASTGEKETASNRIRSKNLIPVLPNATYYAEGVVVGTSRGRACFYDANGAFISGLADFPESTIDKTFTTPSNARYMMLSPSYTYGTTYNHDICINLSDPAKNGTYEPYSAHSYALDDSLTLRGIPTLVDGKIKWDGDLYAPSGKVTRRYGIVDLGTLNWALVSGQTDVFSASIEDLKPCENMYVPNAFIGRYVSVKGNDLGKGDKEFTAGINRVNTVMIKDSAYTDATTFKAAMSGVYIVYELATPTTETADPYVSPQTCHYDGTEEFVSTGIVPVGHNTKYHDNLRMKLDNLPWNFANLIAPTESGFKATMNYTSGQLLIVNNVLYKATANIANGGTITPNTNVTATTLAEVISALS